MRRYHNTNQWRPRRNIGAVLVEGTVSIVMIVFLTLGFLLFLFSMALAAYYKQQIGFMATQAASYASALPSSTANPQASTLAYVQSLEKQLHVGTGNPQVTLTTTTINGVPASSVLVKDSFSVFGIGKGAFAMNVQSIGVAVNTQIASGPGGSAYGSPVAFFTPSMSNSSANGFYPASSYQSQPLIPVYKNTSLTAGVKSLPVYGMSTLSRLGEAYPDETLSWWWR